MISVSLPMRDESRHSDPQKHRKLENDFRRALNVTDRIDCDAQADAAVQRIDLLRQGDRIISRAVVASGLLPSAEGE